MPQASATGVHGRSGGRIGDRWGAARWPRRAGRVAARFARWAGVPLGLAGCVLGGAAVAPGPLASAAFAARASTGWSIVPSPNGARYGDNTLVQVAAGSATSAWAVGYDGYNGNFRTLIQRWNGTRWAVVPSPSIGPLDSVLSGVATQSATSAWAVGYTSVNVPPRIYHRALIEHWNGSTWRVVRTPRAGASDSDLWGVTALSATNAWAVGNENVGLFRFRPLVEHCNGAAWQLVRVPSPPLTGVGASLFGVADLPARHLGGRRLRRRPAVPAADRALQRHPLGPDPRPSGRSTARRQRTSSMAAIPGWPAGSAGWWTTMTPRTRSPRRPSPGYWPGGPVSTARRATCT